MSSKYYKVLRFDGRPFHGGAGGAWSLPKGKRPGQWLPHIKDIEPCLRGYHVCTADNLPLWLGPEVWVAEIKGEIITEKRKTVASDVRLIEGTRWDEDRARLLMADCLAHAIDSIHIDNKVTQELPEDPFILVNDIVHALRDFVKDPNCPYYISNVYARAHRAFIHSFYGKHLGEYEKYDAARAKTLINAVIASCQFPARVMARNVMGSCLDAIGVGHYFDEPSKERLWQAERLTKYLHNQKIPRAYKKE